MRHCERRRSLQRIQPGPARNIKRSARAVHGPAQRRGTCVAGIRGCRSISFRRVRPAGSMLISSRMQFNDTSLRPVRVVRDATMDSDVGPAAHHALRGWLAGDARSLSRASQRCSMRHDHRLALRSPATRTVQRRNTRHGYRGGLRCPANRTCQRRSMRHGYRPALCGPTHRHRTTPRIAETFRAAFRARWPTLLAPPSRPAISTRRWATNLVYRGRSVPAEPRPGPPNARVKRPSS